MKLKTTYLAAMMALGMALSSQAAVVGGQDYIVLEEPVAQQQADKVEVTEFFSYTCIHCYHLNPVLLKHAKTWSKDVYLRPIHVVWDAGQTNLARVAAAVNSSGLKYQADNAVFQAKFEQQIALEDEATFKKWAAAQTTFDGKKLIAAYDSFSNQVQAKQMADLTSQYNIQGTPTVIVGGKYQMQFTSPDWEQNMQKVNEMIAKVKAERGMPASKPAAQVRSRGAALARAANQ